MAHKTIALTTELRELTEFLRALSMTGAGVGWGRGGAGGRRNSGSGEAIMEYNDCDLSVTIAILAQGTIWAVAAQQANLLIGSPAPDASTTHHSRSN